MKRLIHRDLQEWKAEKGRKSLLLRGARQVGKTHAARLLGETFDNCVEINFEADAEARRIFSETLKPERLARNLSLYLKQPIVPGKTLLFLDEIQAAPPALTALRYFYEEMPNLHVIAAGSLLDFVIQQIGIPVGRVASLYMYPLSFMEFLVAIGEGALGQEVVEHPLEEPISEVLHRKLLGLLGEFLVIGGMPEAVKCWRDTQDPAPCLKVHHRLLGAYRQDFQKYAKKFQLKYLDLLFRQIPQSLGKKFKYASVGEGYRKRELEPCLDLLATAGVAYRVTHTAGNGIPIGAEVHFDIFKPLFLDIGLCQALLGLDLAEFFLNPEQALINRGEIAEAYVGQELLAYAPSYKNAELFYWHKEGRGSQAEVDYLHQSGQAILPLEVKSGKGTTLRSLHHFLQSHPNSPYGVRFSTQNYSIHNGIHSYPLYAVAHLLQTNSQASWNALFS